MIVALGNLYYYPLKLYVLIGSYLYFRKLRVVGRNNIPSKGPLIFAINHQNALLDALLLSVISWRNPHFLTRADVFNNKYVDKFLRGLKMLPIYRIRDGFDSIKMNEAIFEAAKDILDRGGVVGIFPEGSHSLQYKIRSLKKGFARIAFRAESGADFNLGLKIVPIGIQYESHFYPEGRTLISFGEPISVADFKEEYEKDQNAGIDAIGKELRSRLKSLILHIDSKQDYDRVLKEFQEKRVYRYSLKAQLDTDQQLVDAIEHGTDIDEPPAKRNVILIFFEKIWRFIWKVVSAIPRWIVDLLVRKSTADAHFFGTLRFVYSIFLYPIIYLALFFLIRYLVF